MSITTDVLSIYSAVPATFILVAGLTYLLRLFASAVRNHGRVSHDHHGTSDESRPLLGSQTTTSPHQVSSSGATSSGSETTAEAERLLQKKNEDRFKTWDFIVRLLSVLVCTGAVAASTQQLIMALQQPKGGASPRQVHLAVGSLAAQLVALVTYVAAACISSDKHHLPSFSNGSFFYAALLAIFFGLESYRIWEDSGMKPTLLFDLSLGLSLAGVLLGFLNILRRYLKASLTLPDYSNVSSKLMTPESHSSIFSLLTFAWMTPLISKGDRTPLTMEDLWQLRETDTSKAVMERFAKSAKPGRSLFYRLVLTVWKPMAIQYTASFCAAFLVYSSPFFLNHILLWFQAENSSLVMGWALLVGLLMCNSLSAMSNGQQYFHGRRVGMQVCASLINEIYVKALKRPAGVSAKGNNNSNKEGDEKKADDDDEEEDSSIGKIVTLISVDANRIIEFVCYSQDPLISFPLQVIIALGGLIIVLGWSSLAGILCLALNGPISTYLSSRVEKVQSKAMKITDKRTALTNETMSGIRIIKYFGWEDQFAQKINKAREEELTQAFYVSVLYVLSTAISYVSSVLCFVVTFGTHTIVFGHTLDAATAFTAVMLLERVSDMLQWGPFLYLWMIKSKVSLDRIDKFLKDAELDEHKEEKTNNHHLRPSTTSTPFYSERSASPDTVTLADSPQLGFKDGRFRYYTQADSLEEAQTKKVDGSKTVSVTVVEDDAANADPAFHLRNITLEFVVGGLNVITGQTGSGKSSLVLALLGEMKRVDGNRFFPKNRENTVAYVAQTAWLLNATIRENILMGEPMDEARYKKTLEDCALVRDLETFTGGDMTEIGERGISLSGGQKQRISIARAVYSNASIVLLDDPLSAVDAPTARHLLKNAIQSGMKGRTVILVTHVIGLAVRVSDSVIVMKEGAVLAHGTPAQIASNPEVTSITNATTAAMEDDDEDEKEAAVTESNDKKATLTDSKDGTKLVQDEEKESGDVRWEIYMTYFKSATFLAVTGTVFFFVLQSALNVVNDAWLAEWTEETRRQNNETFATFKTRSFPPSLSLFNQLSSSAGYIHQAPSNIFIKAFRYYRNADEVTASQYWEENHTALYYVTVYALIGCVLILNRTVNSMVGVIASLRASKVIHERLLASVLGAPLRFFEITPLGRILNRFTKDLNQVDDNIMQYSSNFLYFSIKAVTVVFVIMFFNPLFLLALMPIGLIYRGITRIYLNSSRELKRLESLAMSPLISQFSETLNGASTIRAYGLSEKFTKQNSDKIDIKNRCFYHLWCSNRWLNLRTDLISALFIFSAGVVVLSTRISPGWAGITLLYASHFSDALLWLVRSHADMEMSMNAVERTTEYSELEQEPPRIVEGYRPGPQWPENGEVEVKDLTIRYAADQPLVLKHLNFSTRKGEKIGVVGRTGAGKSTLSLAFFRIIPHATGTIIIDGMDINRMGLHDLRQHLTIIPQDPILFTGTIRSNLDPLNEFEDADLWRVLRSTHVLESMQSSENLQASSDSPAVADSVLHTSASSASLTTISSSSSAKSHNLTLESPVLENGSNFSQGQRQLLCMARAMLRRSKVIFLDEATASIDHATDERIQQTIKVELSEATVFCIAHRLRTVVDFDRILVLGQGEIIEYGTPLDLITKSTVGHFRKMCEDSGEMDELIEMARAASRKSKFVVV